MRAWIGSLLVVGFAVLLIVLSYWYLGTVFVLHVRLVP